jgi:hypothetical protein
MKKANIKQNRFLMLAKTREQIFHINDLARIWKINNRHNLAITLNRYVRGGLLYRIYRGLYSIKKINELDPVELGFKAINSYSYLSGETILVKHGLIFQQLNYYSYMGLKTRRFQIGDYKYYCRQLKEVYLYNDTGIIKSGQSFNEASAERAVADILYFNSSYHFDNIDKIDKNNFKEIQKNVYNINTL